MVFFIIVCISLAFVRRSLSPLMKVYIAYLVVALGIAPYVGPAATGVDPTTQYLAALWLLAAGIGGLLSAVRPGKVTPIRASGQDLLGGALLVSSASLVIGIGLLMTNGSAISTQLAGGVGGGGYLGLAAQVGPPLAAASLLAAMSSHDASRATRSYSTVLVLAQASLLAASGTRGAAPFYLLSVLICGAGLHVAVQQGSRARRVGIVVATATIMMGFFALGATVKQQALLSSVRVQGSALSFANFIPTIVSRFDYSPFLYAANEHRNDVSAQDVVSFSTQALVSVPRALFPNKPATEYGHRVAVTVYGAPNTTVTSATVTTMGDSLINLGVAGAFVWMILYLLLVDGAFRRLGHTRDVGTLGLRMVVVTAALNLEAPTVLNIVGAVRIGVALVVLEWIARKLIQRRPIRSDQVALRGVQPGVERAHAPRD